MRLRALGHSLERERIRGDLTAAYYNFKECYKNKTVKHLSVVVDGRIGGNGYRR